MTVDDALAAPFVAFGTHREIAKQLLASRERWGLSYFTVRSVEDFAPVIEMLRESPPASGCRRRDRLHGAT